MTATFTGSPPTVMDIPPVYPAGWVWLLTNPPSGPAVVQLQNFTNVVTAGGTFLGPVAGVQACIHWGQTPPTYGATLTGTLTIQYEG